MSKWKGSWTKEFFDWLFGGMFSNMSSGWDFDPLYKKVESVFKFFGLDLRDKWNDYWYKGSKEEKANQEKSAKAAAEKAAAEAKAQAEKQQAIDAALAEYKATQQKAAEKKKPVSHAKNHSHASSPGTSGSSSPRDSDCDEILLEGLDGDEDEILLEDISLNLDLPIPSAPPAERSPSPIMTPTEAVPIQSPQQSEQNNVSPAKFSPPNSPRSGGNSSPGGRS